MCRERWRWRRSSFSALCPFVLARYQLSILTELMIFGLLALSLDLIMGYTGMVSFGHAAYFGLGAYGSALILIHFAVPIPVALLAGALLAGAVALPIGYLSTRATGIYFAMLTLAFAQLLYTIAYKWRELTGGSDGIAGVPKTSLWWGGPSLASPAAYFYLVAVSLVALDARLPRARAIAVRPRASGHSRERAEVRGPRPGSAAVQALPSSSSRPSSPGSRAPSSRRSGASPRPRSCSGCSRARRS